jgi:hypothetical protein
MFQISPRHALTLKLSSCGIWETTSRQNLIDALLVSRTRYRYLCPCEIKLAAGGCLVFRSYMADELGRGR